MEHRWGERIKVDLPVRIVAHRFAVKYGRLVNISVSGASLLAQFELRPLSRIQVMIALPHRARSEEPGIAAYVARVGKTSIGIEWCEFAPPVVGEVLTTLAARPYLRLRKPETVHGIAVARRSATLLRHGT